MKITSETKEERLEKLGKQKVVLQKLSDEAFESYNKLPHDDPEYDSRLSAAAVLSVQLLRLSEQIDAINNADTHAADIANLVQPHPGITKRGLSGLLLIPLMMVVEFVVERQITTTPAAAKLYQHSALAGLVMAAGLLFHF